MATYTWKLPKVSLPRLNRVYVTFLWTPLEQNKKMEFHFWHNKASLKFSAWYIHKSGARHEWVKKNHKSYDTFFRRILVIITKLQTTKVFDCTTLVWKSLWKSLRDKDWAITLLPIIIIIALLVIKWNIIKWTHPTTRQAATWLLFSKIEIAFSIETNKSNVTIITQPVACARWS